MLVFNSRHAFVLHCLCEIVKDDLLKTYISRFKDRKQKSLVFGVPFDFDDFVIKFWTYYFCNNRFKCPEDAVL